MTVPGPTLGTDDPLVSVIMIFLDAERFLDEAVASVTAQSYRNWELVLVDDGSTDASPAIARRHSEIEPSRIRVVQQPGRGHGGTGAARNLGLRHAGGAFVIFLDSDDTFAVDQLDQQVTLLRSHPEADAVIGRTRYWYSWSGEIRDQQRDFFTDLGLGLERVVAPPALLPLLWSKEAEFFCLCSYLVRRKVIDRVGGFEDQFNDVYEDGVFHAKVFFDTPIYVADVCWGSYRQHRDSACAQAARDGREAIARQRFLKWIADYLDLRGVRTGSIIDSLAAEMHGPEQSRQARIAHTCTGAARAIGRRTIPPPVRLWLRRRWRLRGQPPLGKVRFGDLRRVTPICDVWGEDRGRPIDRYYIENFLAAHAGDIQGHLLEISESAYTRRFGGDRVTKSDILHVFDEGNPNATIVADLARAEHLPPDVFDCIIFTQTLQLIFDVAGAVRTLHRILKPGGVLLATFPGITQIDEDEFGRPHWYWNFTALSARRLFGEVFTGELTVSAYGNVLAAVSLLHGISVSELDVSELDSRDPHYEVTITVRAVKPKP